MPLSPGLAEWLRSEGHDAVHANDLGLHQAPDSEILRRASAEGRIVITADLDFPRLLASIQSGGPGLILLRGGNYSDVESLGCVRRVLMQIPHETLPSSIIVVDRQKVRRRALPIE
jgi:predicted nuclease of predicted toxin-antitoxin system